MSDVKPFIKDIKVADIKLDLQNPRLPKSKQGKDEKTVIEYLLLEAATEELMLAIAENGFFAGELLLVIEDINDKGKYVVIEGNRRLTAVKLLGDPSIATVKKISVQEIEKNAKHKPTEVPCLVFQEKKEILRYLGFRHITGIKSWRLLEKARYLSEMKQRDYSDVSFIESCSEIAKVIGSRSDYVKRLITGYELYKIVEDEKFYQIDNLNDTKFFLNYFTDSLNRDNIRDFIGIDLNSNSPIAEINKNNLKKITHWWFEKTNGQSRVLGDSEGLKLLDAVVGSVDALDAFDKTPISIYEAYEITGDLDRQFENKVKETLKSIEQADSISNKVKIFYSDLYDDLKTIRKIALKINDFKESLTKNRDDF
ncbi:MAG: ParB N-terminal domain-containing protein [Cyclobacteriaceae bacterium]|nr:ParB N-terminal domain-containing protein [Cyclobacteriaceae bacterium]